MMKQSTRLGILKIAASLELLMFIYVIPFVLRKVFFGNSGGFISFILFIMSATAGFIIGSLLFNEASRFVGRLAETSGMKFVTYILNIEEEALFTAKLVSAFATLLPAITAIIIYSSGEILRAGFEVIFILIPFRVAINSSRKHYQDIMVNGVVYFGFFILAAALVASNFYNPLADTKAVIYFILYTYILIFLVLRNQEDIDSNIYSKKYIQKSILPQNMRSFNLVSVLILFAVIVLLFNLKTVIASVIKYLAILSAKFIFLVLWLLSFVFPKSEVQQQGQPNQEFQLPKEEAAGNNQLLNIISIVVLAAIIVFLLYKLAPVIYRKLSELFSRLIDFIKRIFSVQKPDGSIAGDYDDETETIRQVKGDFSKKAGKFRKRVSGRELKGIRDPVEHVRYTYLLLLRMLDTVGIYREKSDTAAEIYNRSSHLSKGGDPLLKITKLYEKVRYGEYKPGTGDINEVDREFGLAAGYILKK